MLAEAVHSAADSSNQVLLLAGGKQAQQKPTKAHPFGYARAHYLYAFMVAIVLFTLGGAFAIYEAIHKIRHPQDLENPLVAYLVLGIAFTLEGFALRTVTKEAKEFKPAGQSWWQFIRQTKSINHVVLALEDSAALLGLVFATLGVVASQVSGNGVWDGIGTLAIGILLVGVAAVLFQEVKSLLIGEAVSPADDATLRQIILQDSQVNQVLDLKTLYVGPQELFIAMKVAVDHDDTAAQVAAVIDQIEARIRAQYPIAKLIYIEPDLYRHQGLVK